MADDSEKKLKDQGTILLCGKIDDVAIRKVSIDLLDIDRNMDEEKYSHINMILNSPGGDCDAGFMMIDIIGLCRHQIHITGMGICGSMGLMILVAGAKGHRVITHNTSLLCHQYSWGGSGKHHELVARRKEEDMANRRLIRHLVKHTKLNKEKVKKILLPESDVWLTPEEALKYGIADKIV